MKNWKLFPTTSASMSFQMALDEVLLKQMIELRAEQPDHTPTPILRFYYASEPSLTVGYSHPKTGEGHSDLPVYRRLTGGGQVKHGKDLLFSFIAAKEADESFKTVRICYWKLHEAIKLAFQRLGKETRFYRVDDNLPRGGECFVYPIASDLAYGNQKIAGGAQKRSLGVLLHQESIQAEVANIDDLDKLADEIKKGFEEIFETKIQKLEIDPDTIFNAEDLAESKYTNCLT